ncbi:MAG: hypothetical protein N2690_05600 [Rhodocyclaceae bacterium]|nr:hypothetical protein [Rhodocyclaceae bacterium]
MVIRLQHAQAHLLRLQLQRPDECAVLEAVKALSHRPRRPLRTPALEVLDDQRLGAVLHRKGCHLRGKPARRIQAQARDAPMQRHAVPLPALEQAALALLGCDDRAQSVAPVVVPAAGEKLAGYHRAGGVDDGGGRRSVDAHVDGAHTVFCVGEGLVREVFRRPNLHGTRQADLGAAHDQRRAQIH